MVRVECVKCGCERKYFVWRVGMGVIPIMFGMYVFVYGVGTYDTFVGGSLMLDV